MLMPDETYEEQRCNNSSFTSSSSSTTLTRIQTTCRNEVVVLNDIDEVAAAMALATIQKCDDFLKRHNIKPEFFCKHRERLALQTWLLQRSSKYNSGEFNNNEKKNIQIYN